MFGLQPIHIVIIVLIALLVFGPAKLPELGKNLGKAIRDFRNSAKDAQEELKGALDDRPERPAPDSEQKKA
jgi:sec-independent protein translocase protein TatA